MSDQPPEQRPASPSALLDFDGCNRECRRAGEHTRRWGGCEHAPEPEPKVSLSRVYLDTDGHPSIGFETYTAAQLARLLEPALRAVGILLTPLSLQLISEGHSMHLTAGEYRDLAHAAAQALLNRP